MYEDQALQIDFLRHRVQIRGRAGELSATEFRLLTALVNNADIVLSPARLLDLVWGETEVTHDNIRVFIGSLRKKLDGAPHQLIETVRGFGYRYNPPNSESGVRTCQEGSS